MYYKFAITLNCYWNYFLNVRSNLFHAKVQSLMFYCVIIFYRIFNTNNLWMKLKSIVSLVEENRLNMEVIVNPKVIELFYGIVKDNIWHLESCLFIRCKFFLIKKNIKTVKISEKNYKNVLNLRFLLKC